VTKLLFATILVIVTTIYIIFGHVYEYLAISLQSLFLSPFQKNDFSFGFHPRRAIYVPLIANVTKINHNPMK